MQLSPQDQAWLREALEGLSVGGDRRFEDALWLGFGDGWRPMLGLLERNGYIRIGGADRATPAMTARGEQLLGQLRQAAVAKVG